MTKLAKFISPHYIFDGSGRISPIKLNFLPKKFFEQLNTEINEKNYKVMMWKILKNIKLNENYTKTSLVLIDVFFNIKKHFEKIEGRFSFKEFAEFVKKHFKAESDKENFYKIAQVARVNKLFVNKKIYQIKKSRNKELLKKFLSKGAYLDLSTDLGKECASKIFSTNRSLVLEQKNNQQNPTGEIKCTL